jgi:hypothetical protein
MWALWADAHNMAVSEVAFYMDNARCTTDLSDRYHSTHGVAIVCFETPAHVAATPL